MTLYESYPLPNPSFLTHVATLTATRPVAIRMTAHNCIDSAASLRTSVTRFKGALYTLGRRFSTVGGGPLMGREVGRKKIDVFISIIMFTKFISLDTEF